MVSSAACIDIELTNGTGNQRRFTVADGTGIAKYRILALTDPRTATGTPSAETTLAGIAAFEKVASDGSTSLTAWTDGIFDMTASGAITLGAPVGAAGADNFIKMITDVASGAALQAGSAKILGYAMKTFSDGETGPIRVRL